MVEVNHTQLRELLLRYYHTRTPVFIWGTFGIGKSMVISKVAEAIAKHLKQGFIVGEPDGKEKFGFIDVRMSQLEPSDLRGLPNISKTKDGDVTRWITPNWLPKNVESCGILFFDELNLATPIIQASAYQLILDRRLGDYKLPDGWVIVCAGNTSQDRANVFELPAPLSNRFAHLELKVPTKDDWVVWALHNNIEPSIISFLEFKPSLLYKFDKNTKSKAIPTPRSWEYASRLIANTREISLEDKQILVSSAVGDGVGIEFMAFLKLQRKIDIRGILKNPKLAEQIKEIDLKWSLLSVLVEEYKTKRDTLEPILQVCDYIEPEFVIRLLSFLKESRSEFKADAPKTKSWKSIQTKYFKYVEDD